MCFALVGMATGLGARYPRFAADNASQVAGSYGGIAFMIAAVMFVAVTIALIGWPSSVYIWHQIRHRPIPADVMVMMGVCFSGVIVSSIAVWLLGMRTGVTALENL